MMNAYSISIGIALLLLFLYLAIIGVAIANYVVSALGLQKLAAKFQLDKAWLAWIPIGNEWLLGKIVEKEEENKTVRKPWSMIMLVLASVFIGGMFVFYVVYFFFVFSLISVSNAGSSLIGMMIIVMIIFLAVVVVWALASVAYTVCLYICMYKNFEALVPEKSLNYMLLSVLVPLAKGLLLLKCAKNMGNMEPMDEPVSESAETPFVQEEVLPAEEEEF